LPQHLVHQGEIRHLRNIHVFFDVPGFLFERDQSFDRLRLDAGVFAEERRREIVGLLEKEKGSKRGRLLLFGNSSTFRVLKASLLSSFTLRFSAKHAELTEE
jgi:hypothetical protein